MHHSGTHNSQNLPPNDLQSHEGDNSNTAALSRGLVSSPAPASSHPLQLRKRRESSPNQEFGSGTDAVPSPPARCVPRPQNQSAMPGIRTPRTPPLPAARFTMTMSPGESCGGYPVASLPAGSHWGFIFACRPVSCVGPTVSY